MCLFWSRSQNIFLSYCANIHPAEDLETTLRYLKTHAVQIQQRCFSESHLGLGLWVSARFAQELLHSPEKREALQAFTRENHLFHFTFNGFPYGRFHTEVVKEKVFRPSWLESERLHFLQELAFLLSQFLPDSVTKGSISTLSGTFKPEQHSEKVLQQIAKQQIQMIPFLKELEEKTGKQIVIALEPEPFNTLETTEEVVDYFQRYLFPCAQETLKVFGKEAESLVTRYLGICYDTCHQACQFENLRESLLQLKAAGIPVHKVQLSNALHLASPEYNPVGVEKLKTFQELVYLHQLIGKRQQQRERVRDLSDFFETIYPQNQAYWNTMEAWRVHFHVPLFYRGTPELQTTQEDLSLAIQTLLQEELTQHFEIETYTWEVIPQEERQRLRKTLTEGLIHEFEYVLEIFEKHQVRRNKNQ